MGSVPPPSVGAWKRRPAAAVTRLAGRPLLLLSSRDLMRAALEEKALLVALAAPTPSAMLGFARASRDSSAPLLLLRPSGAGDERGPEEAREDALFIDAALKAADAVGFLGPMALLKDPPRPGSPISEGERIDREVDSGFTGVSLLVKDDFHSARDGALQAARACRLELGLELVIANESPALAVELAAELRSRGVNPSCLRVSGHEAECRPLADQLGSLALSSEREALGPSLRTTGVQELVAAGPFLRSLKRTAPRDLWWKLTHWADERQASLDQSTAKHARALRELPAPSQDKLEALCCYEAAELFARTGAAGTGLRIASRIATYAEEHA